MDGGPRGIGEILAAVSYMDAQLGRMLDEFDRLDLTMRPQI